MQRWSIQNELAFIHFLLFDHFSFTALRRSSSTPEFIFPEWLKCHSRAGNASWLKVSPRNGGKDCKLCWRISVLALSEKAVINQSTSLKCQLIKVRVCVWVCVCVAPAKQDVPMKVHFQVCSCILTTMLRFQKHQWSPSKCFDWNYKLVFLLKRQIIITERGVLYF